MSACIVTERLLNVSDRRLLERCSSKIACAQFELRMPEDGSKDGRKMRQRTTTCMTAMIGGAVHRGLSIGDIARLV